MAVKGNSSNEAQVKEFKLYTGINNVKIIAINPTLEEAKALGLPLRDEPKYEVDDKGNFRLDFYVSTGVTKTKIAIFLKNEIRISKDGNKCEYINNIGQTSWGNIDNPTFADWFSKEGVRAALSGESTLISLIINWLNIKPGDECYLDTITKIVKGDIKEIKDLFTSYKNNEFRVMFTVREGKYQSVYTGYFDRATNKSFTYWTGHLNKQKESGYALKEAYSFEFKEYVPTVSDEETKPEPKKDVF